MPLLFALMAYSITFGWTYLLRVWPLTTGALASGRLTTLRSHPWGFILARKYVPYSINMQLLFLGYASIVLVLFMNFLLSNKSLCLLQGQLRVEL